MKLKKKYKLLKKRLDKIEAILKPNSITLTDLNDENHTVKIEINSEGNYESYHQRKTQNFEKETITKEN
jgi:hypothetical protein